MILPPSAIQMSDSCQKGLLLYAGARNVVSLWNVNDSATAGLMKGFYQNLNRGTAEKRSPAPGEVGATRRQPPGLAAPPLLGGLCSRRRRQISAADAKGLPVALSPESLRLLKPLCGIAGEKRSDAARARRVPPDGQIWRENRRC